MVSPSQLYWNAGSGGGRGSNREMARMDVKTARVCARSKTGDSAGCELQLVNLSVYDCG